MACNKKFVVIRSQKVKMQVKLKGKWENEAKCRGNVKREIAQKYICLYTGCSRRNVPDFGRVFLMLKYTDTTQNTYIQRLNGYGDNGQREVGASCGSKYCNLHS